MPGPIQVIPPGLMGLLQLKTGGNLPNNLADTVAPVLELRDWYLTARRLDSLSLFPQAAAPARAFTTGNNGNFAFTLTAGGNTQVPQNQFWYVEEMTVNGNIATAADTIRFAPAIFTAQGISFSTIQQVGVDVNDVITARARTISAAASRGFWAFPGDIFGVVIFDILSAGGITLNLNLRATPCPS